MRRFTFHFLVFKVNPLWVQLAYFIVFSLVGYRALNMSKPKIDSFRPKNIDMFFTFVSAATVSSLSTVEMKVFSNHQLILMTILMLIGREVFTSKLGLQLLRSRKQHNLEDSVNSASNSNLRHSLTLKDITSKKESASITCSTIENDKPVIDHDLESNNKSFTNIESLKYKATTYLSNMVLRYM
ncbi:hypothetical protein PTKIN_Ptkin03bG0121600 [Pterospermum kingtungense]